MYAVQLLPIWKNKTKNTWNVSVLCICVCWAEQVVQLTYGHSEFSAQVGHAKRVESKTHEYEVLKTHERWRRKRRYQTLLRNVFVELCVDIYRTVLCVCVTPPAASPHALPDAVATHQKLLTATVGLPHVSATVDNVIANPKFPFLSCRERSTWLSAVRFRVSGLVNYGREVS